MKQQGDRDKNLRAKNLALVSVLFGLVLLFYILTFVRFGGSP